MIYGLCAVPVKKTTSTEPFTLNNFCVGPFTFTTGDLSAHSYLWDKYQPANQRVETVEDWLISKIASILGIISHTRQLNHWGAKYTNRFGHA